MAALKPAHGLKAAMIPAEAFFAAKAAVSKPNDRRSQGVFNYIMLYLELAQQARRGKTLASPTG